MGSREGQGLLTPELQALHARGLPEGPVGHAVLGEVAGMVGTSVRWDVSELQRLLGCFAATLALQEVLVSCGLLIPDPLPPQESRQSQANAPVYQQNGTSPPRPICRPDTPLEEAFLAPFSLRLLAGI